MADESKRATTSVPRKRDPQATAKAPKKASKPTAASKTTTAKSTASGEKKVKTSSTSTTAKKVTKKAVPAEAKSKVASKKTAKKSAAPTEASQTVETTAGDAPAAKKTAKKTAAPVEAPKPAEAPAAKKTTKKAAAPAETPAAEAPVAKKTAKKASVPAKTSEPAETPTAEAPAAKKSTKKAAAPAEASEPVETPAVEAPAAKKTAKVEAVEAPAAGAKAPVVEETVTASTEEAPAAEAEPAISAKAAAAEEAEPEATGVVEKAPAKKKTAKKTAKKKSAKKSSTARSARSSPPLLKNYEFIGVPSFKGQVFESRPVVVAPPPPAPRQLTLEERLESLQARFARLSDPVRKQIQEQLDMSWIYHDSALEGVVYSYQELKTALGPDQTLVQESNLQPVIEEIRRHRAAIELVRECAAKRTPVTVDLVKKIYLTLHPEEGDLKTVKYRKDIPQHRLYFHEYAPPDKIAAKVRQVIDWVNEPEAKKGRNALRVAARAHYDFLRAFPFTTDSGKVARLLMNLLLLQAGYEPAIIHSTERQRYYDALKGSAPTIITMVIEAEENAVMSLEKLLDERETRLRGFTG